MILNLVMRLTVMASLKPLDAVSCNMPFAVVQLSPLIYSQWTSE